MEIDETRRDDETSGVDLLSACERSAGDLGDLPAPDANVPDGIEPRFRIDHTASQNDEIEILRTIGRRTLESENGGDSQAEENADRTESGKHHELNTQSD